MAKLSSGQYLEFVSLAQIPAQSKKWESIRLSTLTILQWGNADAWLEVSPRGKSRGNSETLKMWPVRGEVIEIPENDYNITLKMTNPTIGASHFKVYAGDLSSSLLFADSNTLVYPSRPGLSPTAGTPVLYPVDIRTRIEVPKLHLICLNVGAQMRIGLVALDESGAAPAIAFPLTSSDMVTADYKDTLVFTTSSPLNPGDQIGISMTHVGGVPAVSFCEII